GSSSHHRKDYYKISLIEGSGTFVYAGEKIIIEDNSIVFLDPQVPYGELQTINIKNVYVCAFDQAFFHQYKSISSYSVFQPGNNMFQLNEEQFLDLKNIYQRMLEEIECDYIYKYDLLRTLVTELVLYTIKMKSASKLSNQPISASERISILFAELLERQFPIDDIANPLTLRSASDYAKNLNIHVNHLNRALKETTNKTTSQLIIERILQEAKILLKQTSWTVSEIAYALGYTEATHFNNTFKKYLDMTPTDFRNTKIV
ncbi:MAG TPA: helix-turn-helix transcriptional regulator, partial [Balneolaceae bacterium]|nr:helix-turn-helix transcriptional regulator [Balneolaceae bacterium]